MAKLYRKLLLLAKAQVSQGTDPVPTAGANAMLVRSTTPQLITADFVGRDNIKPFMGNNSQLAAGIHREIEFEVEMAGAGSAGGTPAWACLLNSCGFSAAAPGGSPGEYKFTPISDSIPYVTLYVYLDGLRAKMVDCLGTVTFDFTSKAIPVMRFRFVGEYEAMTDTALPTGVDYTSFVAPVTVGKVWTPTFTLHGVTACLQSLSIDMANQLVYRDLVGCGGPIISNRAPTGTAVFELPAVATKAWDEAIKNSTEGALNFVHGRTAGNIVQIECPVVTANNPSITDQDGVAMLSLGLAINPTSAGNDELILTLA